ncbi:MAG: HAMP domain-containing protein [Deltaproteobacteria bacterium]|nr:HAMP domain-containing protein [Deltaproteobacteria bacterium]
MRSLLHKLLLSSLLVILLPIGLAILWTSNTFSTLLERRFAEKSKAQAERVKLLLNEKQEIATGLVSWIAEMPGVKAALKRKDRDGLFQLLLPLVGSVELDFIEILNQEGEIFLRVHNPSRYGDRPALAKDVQGLLQGMRDLPNYGVEERDGNAYLRAAESIEGEGILGVVSAGYALKRDFLRELEQIADARVVIAVANQFYSAEGTNLPGKMTPGNAQVDDSQDLQWHRNDPSPYLEIRLPLETLRGKEGVISLFFPSQEMTAAIGALQKTLFSVALVGIALALSVSWILSRRLTRPLKKLVVGTEQVAAGNYAGAVRTDSRDEIGALATSFNRMLEELRRSKAEVESYRQELERKFAERGKELKETEKKRAAMAHMIAHDLKNPLLGIKKTLERLEQTPPEINGEQRKRILTDLLSAGDLVIGMVNEMLDLYRSDFGDLPLSLTSFQMEELIQTSLRILGPELEEKKLQVLSRSDPLHISVVADKKRLTRLLINLLSNAVKFSPDHGRIHISTALLEADRRSAPQVILSVEDEGMGIAEKDLPTIFDRFYSRDQGNVETGTGLGLPYCKLVAEAHGGKILAERRNGGGFVVSVVLPLNTTEGKEAYGT